MATSHGKLVKVNDRNMHIRQMGDGQKTIVLLPGYGVPLPTVEFAPLMRELAKKYTVCTVELAGYGHSDGTDTPRTNENYVQEIRETLILAGLKPPYVLMPYSASGIYCEYYAAKYPEEVEALILLDSTPTVEAFAELLAFTEDDAAQMKSEYESFIMPTGEEYEEVSKAAIAEYVPHGYTEEEVEETNALLNHANTLIAQALTLSECVLEAMSMPIPKDIPILAFSSDTAKELANLDGEEMDKAEIQRQIAAHEQYRKDHMARLGGHAKFVIVKDSTHGDIYYHRDYRDIICDEIDTFLA